MPNFSHGKKKTLLESAVPVAIHKISFQLTITMSLFKIFLAPYIGAKGQILIFGVRKAALVGGVVAIS